MTGTMQIETPADEAAIAARVRDARAAGSTLAIEGNGSKRGMLYAKTAARILSTRNHAGISLYSPQELVLSAHAGTELRTIEAALAEKGQQLISEPPDFSWMFRGGAQTLGGIVACNLSGPRRIALGATRDHVLGIRAVNGLGEVIRSGGRVLKNVTGLDLCKLLTGSYGTLAVLSEITLKVLPAAQASATVMIPRQDAASAVAALSAGLGSPYGVSGAAYLPVEAAAHIGLGTSVTLLRLEDFTESVAYRSARLQDGLRHFGEATLLTDPQKNQAIWHAVRDALPLAPDGDEAIWRVSVRPSSGPDVMAALPALGARGFMDWGGGLVWIAGPATVAVHTAISAAAALAGGTWALWRAPDTLRGAVAVIPPEPEPLARIAARVQAALDPDNVFARPAVKGSD